MELQDAFRAFIKAEIKLETESLDLYPLQTKIQNLNLGEMNYLNCEIADNIISEKKDLLKREASFGSTKLDYRKKHNDLLDLFDLIEDTGVIITGDDNKRYLVTVEDGPDARTITSALWSD
jgi:hypothetical protein